MILVVSCYELGHQPLAAASAVGFLERAGHRSEVLDLSVEPPGRLDEVLRQVRPSLVAVSVPMHTALHIGVRAARGIRELAPGAHVCFFGLYATLNADHLLGGVADSVIGGEAEGPLVGLADAIVAGRPLEGVDGLTLPGRPARPYMAKLAFPAPDRHALPPLERYARLETGGATRLAAAVEASRGCLHLCRHCPIPPVYGGRFFVVPRETVLEDIRRLVAAGAEHITFADPDFFNGPGHSMAIVRAMHEEFPSLSFDATIKIEHVLERRDELPRLAEYGCAFVVSAVESLSDEVLGHLLKGHTRADVSLALALLRAIGLPLRPSLVAFTPWTRLEDYLDVLDWVDREDLVGHVDPVQLSIRLLVPPGSPLASLDAMRPHLRSLVPESFSWTWEHPDPRMDRLHREVSAIVRDATRTADAAEHTFDRIRDAAFAAADSVAPLRASRFLPSRAISPPPRLTEPWFC